MDTIKGMLKVLLVSSIIIGGAIGIAIIEGNEKPKQTTVIALNEDELAIKKMYNSTLSNRMTEEWAKELEQNIEVFIADTYIKYGSNVKLKGFDALKNEYKDNIKRHLDFSIKIREEAEKKRIEEEKQFQENLIKFNKNCLNKGKTFKHPESVLKSLNKNQIRRMFVGNLQIGDPLAMALGSPGKYRITISKSKYSEIVHMYGRDYAIYNYITVNNGNIDYMSK